jgi:hypothetical protein
MDVHQLSDRAEIQDQLLRYYRGLDRHDLELVRSVFHDDAQIVFPTFYEGDRDGYIDFLASPSALAGVASSKHVATNVLIELAGDVAFTETHVIAHQLCREDSVIPGWAGRFIVIWLRYIDRMERRDGTWAIAHRRFVFDWVRDDTDAGTWSPLPQDTLGRRDTQDPLYRVAV